MAGTRAKRVASVTSIGARPRKRVNRSTSNDSSRARDEVDPASNDAEYNESGSAGEVFDLEELQNKLAEDRKHWRSRVYSFFDAAVGIDVDDGRVCYVFTCAAESCKAKKHEVRRYQDSKDSSSTGNLRRHAEGCFGKDVVAGETEMTDSAQGGQPPKVHFNGIKTDLELRARIVMWVTRDNRPADIVSDSQLVLMLAATGTNLTVPSPNTVRRDVKAVYAKCRQRISKFLQDLPGHIHIGTDAWTSTNHCAFVAWTVHIEHEGCMMSFLLDIVALPESHTGLALAKAFQRMLENHGLEKKVLGVTADNASSNNTQWKEFAAMDNSFEAKHHVRCFNHTLQLSAKALLSPFTSALGKVPDIDFDDGQHDLGEESDDDDDDDEGDSQPDILDINDVDDDGIDELADLDSSAREELMKGVAVISAAISKLRGLSFSIIRSTTVALPAWRHYCEDFTLKQRKFPRDVATRWNSTFDMLNFALGYRRAIDVMTADKNLKLRKFELEDDEWVIVQDLVNILEIYKDMTLYFSKDSASAAMVIPAMDTLSDSHNHHTNEPYHPAVGWAIKLARNKMNRYYSLTDSSRIYRIAMVLHPRMKLEYFHDHDWPTKWIETAERLVRKQYSAKYETQAASVEPTQKKSLFSFGNHSGTTRARVSELEQFLRSPTEDVGDEGPLKWWTRNKNIYPDLSRMALDYLSVPATSTAVERVFSQGRQLLPFTRNGLSSSSIQAFLCLGSWTRCGIISFDDVLAALSGGEMPDVVTRRTPSVVASGSRETSSVSLVQI